jgi:SAM-dependent methyltransferase
MSTAYSSSFYEMIEKMENNHFWFLARNKLIGTLISKYFPNTHKKSFLEIGFGTGVVIRMLEKKGFEVTGIDIKKKALEYAGIHTKAELIQQSIYSYKTKKRYDAVGTFDVVEHQKKDTEVFKIAYSLLKSGGYVFVTVPAQKWLWSEIDVLSKHERRYSISEIREKLEKAGFRIEFINYWQMILLPIFFLRRLFLMRKNTGMLEEYLESPGYLINKLLYYLLLIEQFIVLKVRLPIGTSLIVCAKKIN